MSRRKPLGRLVIAFGPETHDAWKKLDTDLFQRSRLRCVFIPRANRPASAM